MIMTMKTKILTLSAGIVPVRFESDETNYLLLRCFNYWDFPKGEVEAGEDPLLTARRELAEETGLLNPSLQWGERFTETPPYAKGKIARYYLAECGQGEVKLSPNAEGILEHHEYRWVSYEEAKGLLGPRVQTVLEWARSLIEKKASPEG